MSQMFRYNVLVTLDRNYLKVLRTMLYSLSQSDSTGIFTVYVAHNSLTEDDFAALQAVLPRTELIDVPLSEEMFQDAPISDRYPKEMYYRLFAAQYLPQELDRILYLDPDLVVINSLRSLYEIDFGDNLFAAASHIESRTFKNFNRRRLHLSEQARYINSGVMMMNLSLLRTQQDPQQIYQFIEEHKNTLLLPDQDVVNALYADRTIFLDPLIYNLGEKYLRLKNLHLPKEEKLGIDWVRQHTAIIHYYGRNKPWKEGYHGKLGVFYDFFTRELDNL
ncbi:glycosyltransferase family 8 protein [uncultured Negativibacillus sp.]|uniref:glycosyltransferase family 8 protein n=1 Tax=uncultured Negativibacillus sp. TaxID=1980696 RepID=UPI0025DE62C1|nr:glycosyltransferase family 8 protein [uncultured Negativibacillus sp.]